MRQLIFRFMHTKLMYFTFDFKYTVTQNEMPVLFLFLFYFYFFSNSAQSQNMMSCECSRFISLTTQHTNSVVNVSGGQLNPKRISSRVYDSNERCSKDLLPLLSSHRRCRRRKNRYKIQNIFVKHKYFKTYKHVCLFFCFFFFFFFFFFVE